MRSFLVAVLALHFLAVCYAARPNFITEEEFAAIPGKSKPISNASLPSPKYGEGNVPHPRTGFGPRLWTNSEVPYTLDPNFDGNQRFQVALAIQAYHDATCIRFIPRQNHHTSWVDILYDPEVCGAADLCMNSGPQFAKFGGACMNAGTMIRELGHTLCMGNEQTRLDRDEWIDFNTEICRPPPIDGPDFNRGLHKLYDYVSVEHNEAGCYNGCYRPKQPGVTKCGSGGPLSVLDIEVLNELYSCQSGCLSYRYVNSRNELTNLVPVGKDPDGDALYSCRAYHNGDIIPGKYRTRQRDCHVAWNNGEHRKTGDHIEVLTNPHGANFQWVRSGYLPGNAIRGGRTNERETLYVIRCEYSRNGETVNMPGKYHPTLGPYTSYGGQELKCGNFEFLVCVFIK